MSVVSFVPYLPEIIIGLVAVFLFIFGMFIHKTTEFYKNILLVVLSVFIIVMYGTFARISEHDAFNIKNLVLSVMGMFSLLLLKVYANYQIGQSYERPLFLIFVIIGAGIAMESFNLIEFYLAIELYSIGLYFLVFYDKYQKKSIDSGVKYWKIGVVSSAVMIFGISLIYGYSDTLDINEIKEINNFGLALGLSFLLAGILIKLGVVPFHLWVKEVYAKIMLPIISVFAVLGQVTLLICINKFQIIKYFDGIIEFCAISSMLVGVFGALHQKEFKKMIAYLVIMCSGYALVPMIIGANSYSLMMYLISYIFAMTGLIAVLCSFRKGSVLVNEIKDVTGIAKFYPIRTALFFIFLLSLIGFAPLAGFFAKFPILMLAFKNGYEIIGVVGILTGLVSIILVATLAKIMVFGEGKTELSYVNGSLKVVIAVCLLFTCFFVFLLRHILFFVKESGL